MDRNPLYFSSSIGGLSTITSPDKVDPTIIPSFYELLSDYTNYNAAIINSANHLKVLMSSPSVSPLPTDPEQIIYTVIAYDSNSQSYYLAEESSEADIVGLCLGIISTPDGDCVVIQRSGFVTPLLCIGQLTPIPFPDNDWYLQTSGELHSVGTLRVVSRGVINVVRETIMVKQAITNTGLNFNGLNLVAQPGLTVTIGDGTTTHRVNYQTVTTIATLPANSIKRVYITPNQTVSFNDRQYLVVPFETNLDYTALTLSMVAGTASSGMVITGTPNSIRATTAGTWCMGAASNTWTVKNRYQYYQFTYAGGSSNNMFGMVGYNPSGVWSGAAYFSITTNTRTIDNVYLSLQAANPAFINTSNWTVYHTAAIANANSAGTKTYRILVDQVAKVFYMGIDGTWLNSGQPIAKYNGTYTILPAFATATTTSFFTFAVPSTFTPPAGFAGYQYYNKTTNSSYTYNYTNPSAVTAVYSPVMYLGEVTTNASAIISISSPPLNNIFTDEVSISELTTFNHGLRTIEPVITMNQQTNVTYTVNNYWDYSTISTDIVPTQPTKITISC